MNITLNQLQVEVIPALQDNYVFVGHHSGATPAFVVDPPEPDPVLKFLRKQNLTLESIFITHHHSDHIGGVAELKRVTGAKIFGFGADQSRLPPIDFQVRDLQSIVFHGVEIQVWEIPAHTSGHIAYYLKEENALFCGDTLFGLGCGRLFEGTPPQLLKALLRIRNLPDSTHIFCAHEYTIRNLAFAKSIDPNNQALRSRGELLLEQANAGNTRTVPLHLGTEKSTNPFLRWDSPEIKKGLYLAPNTPNEEVIRVLRLGRDAF